MSWQNTVRTQLGAFIEERCFLDRLSKVAPHVIASDLAQLAATTLSRGA